MRDLLARRFGVVSAAAGALGVALILVAELGDAEWIRIFGALLITAGGIVIRTRVDEIRRIGRATEGVRVINLGSDDRVVSIEAVAKAETTDQPAAGARVDINAMLAAQGDGATPASNGDGALELDLDEEADATEPEEEE